MASIKQLKHMSNLFAFQINENRSRPVRSVSFVSAATEIIFALGEEQSLRAVTSVCDYPMQAQNAPRRVICRSTIDASSMTSEEVTDAVAQLKNLQEKARLEGESGLPRNWIIDVDALKAISPSVVFVQSTCAVCDAGTDDVFYALREAQLLGKCQIVSTAPTTITEMFQAIHDVGLALNVETKAKELVARLKERLEAVRVGSQNGSRPRVVSFEGLAPLCTGGGWLPDMKERAGCIDALGDKPGCKPKIRTWKDIQDADPDIILISPCSGSPTRTMNELHLLASAAEFWSLRCVQRGDVYVLDHSIFSRPGPRLIDGIEMLAALLKGCKVDDDRTKEWTSLAYKYECRVDMGDSTAAHCTTELAQRFKPCFGGHFASAADIPLTSDRLVRCQVTRSTIPGSSLPGNRSAQTLLPIPSQDTAREESLILFGGEAADGTRLSDVWVLHAPSRGWREALEAAGGASPELGKMPTWEKVQCGSIYGENVPTPRSNHASVICKDCMLVFGGWGESNIVPLSHCELLHLDTFCWTHCSTIGTGPPPRGNPTLVYFERINSIVMFGGWDGKARRNDTWRLDMNNWKWEEIVTETAPKARSDHSAVMWKRGTHEQEDAMLLFGGSVEGTSGASSELWAFQFQTETESWSWSKIETVGPAPPGRTSHATCVAGSGISAQMIVVGGTDATKGCSRRGVVPDAWILTFGKEPGGVVGRWGNCASNQQNEFNRCRHSIACVGNETMIAMWGGFDGNKTVADEATIFLKGWFGEAEKDKDVASADAISSPDVSDVSGVKVFDRWEAEVPVTLDDLPPSEFDKAKRSKLPGALAKALHRCAVAMGKDTYIDPSSGYSVFTQLYLKKRECCGNGCRHCPYGHINVPGKGAKVNAETKDLEW